ncbi:MAG: hypothetical protein U0V87_10910 [Acidobacteriota bacterium]
MRRVKVLDGLYYSFRLLEYFHGILYPSCCSIRSSVTGLVPAIASAWGFIDALHRARQLSQLVPGLGRRHLELRRFLAETELAETYRHYIQHLRRELADESAHDFPVWGSISWADPEVLTLSHTAVIGTVPPDVSVTMTSAVFDWVENRWVSRVSLGIRGSVFNFDPLFQEAQKFENFVVPWMAEKGNIELVYGDAVPVVSCGFIIGVEPPNSAMQPPGADAPGG